MRILATTLLFLIITAFSLSAQDDKDKPEIIFEETTHNYGTIEQNGNGTCVFKFKNTGKQPLLLKNVKSSCGCTVPKWSKKPIPKRKKGEITVKYNTRRIGSFTKSITVYSNAKNSPERLIIKGKVVKKKSAKTSPKKEKSEIQKG